MLKAIVTVGISASGKTTFAQSLVKQGGWVDVNRDWIRFNIVSAGSSWKDYKFSKSKENEVTKIQERMVSEAFFNDQNVIISDTNLNLNTLNKWISYLEEIGYTVAIETFPITLEEAWKRDSLRENGVGHSVIARQWKQWLEYTQRKTYVKNQNKPKAFLFDIDGTLAVMNGRGPFDWDRVGEDDPVQQVVSMAIGMYNQGHSIICLSGRDGSCYDLTYTWLQQHGIPFSALLMREAGDMRKDTVVKEEIFWNCVEPYWCVEGVVDDRPSVLRMWRDIKIPIVIGVGDPYIEF